MRSLEGFTRKSSALATAVAPSSTTAPCPKRKTARVVGGMSRTATRTATTDAPNNTRRDKGAGISPEIGATREAPDHDVVVASFRIAHGLRMA